MPTIPQRVQTDGSSTFDADALFNQWQAGTLKAPADDYTFQQCISQSFGLQGDDDYGYMASIEVTLPQAQRYLDVSETKPGMLKWYGRDHDQPPKADVQAYVDIFKATTITANVLKGLAANAKKDSIRADVAKHLLEHYTPATGLTISKSKTHINPYADLWSWSCHKLQWVGPTEKTVTTHSHPILPLLYHHFGCVCPSYEAVETIRQIAAGRRIADIGSGNGYWTYMLRRPKPGAVTLAVDAIDNGISEWRTMWIPDTIEMDGADWLKKHGTPQHVLMLVYPSIGNAFTAKVISAYNGDTIIIAGTQNRNGYTAFKELLVDWFAREMPSWQKRCQIPLPSFAGKDEALFVYQKA